MRLPDGTEHYSGALDADFQRALIDWIEGLQATTPFYRPTMPRSGRPFSVEMTNAGVLGWVSDKSGYRYQPTHPFTGERWVPIPSSVIGIWERYARFPAPPEACLVNRYRGTAKLGSHVDSDEAETRAAVVSISLGDDAVFHVGGPKRGDPKAKITLRSGDIFVLGGASRLAYHGIDRVLAGTSDVVPGGGRINLTLRRVTRVAEIG